MAGPLKPVIQQDVSKGMNAVTNPYDIGQQQSIYLQNLILDEHGSLRTRDGWMLQTTSPDLAPTIRPIVKLFDFVQDATGGGGTSTGGGGGGTGITPVVVITNPVNNTTFPFDAGAVTIVANATAAAGLTIASVDFSVNGAIFATVTTAPYVTGLGLSPGATYTLVATATDSAGNVQASAPVTIAVGT